MISAATVRLEASADIEPPFTAYFRDKPAHGLQAEHLEDAVKRAEEIGDAICVAATGEAMPLKEFDDDAIEAEFKRRFGDDLVDAAAVRRAYSLMAEGDIKLAMQELERAYALPPAHHECAIADLLARARA
ncbi:hypothetical protein M2360_000897 [Rhizobium sp. SG_E_25_P2]|uniref:hypothetical protein n=1 Tax=Rhizobium sp. SG_E_25_P2 TaxID=2879942 RepID=UPI0024742099|nr:hypothetical protein [Rhizobium sp. SG_E_25_P2]MDH6265507.1 hypothetical protein [Rhizobium sp. SG_E_25_P2]